MANSHEVDALFFTERSELLVARNVVEAYIFPDRDAIQAYENVNPAYRRIIQNLGDAALDTRWEKWKEEDPPAEPLILVIIGDDSKLVRQALQQRLAKPESYARDWEDEFERAQIAMLLGTPNRIMGDWWKVIFGRKDQVEFSAPQDRINNTQGLLNFTDIPDLAA